MSAGTAWDLGVQKVYQSAIQPARTRHGSTFGTTDMGAQVTGDVVE